MVLGQFTIYLELGAALLYPSRSLPAIAVDESSYFPNALALGDNSRL